MDKENIKNKRYTKSNDVIKSLNFDFFNNALISFSESIKRNFQIYDETLPVYFFNTGDEIYLFESENEKQNSNFNSVTSTQQVPRNVLSINDISINSDELTNPHIRAEFIIKNKELNKDSLYSSEVRRIPLTLNIKSLITTSNLLQQFKYLEILLLSLYKGNNFEFMYLNKTNKGYYKISDSFETTRNFELSFDSTSRKPTILVNIDVDLQYPAFDYVTNILSNDFGGRIIKPEVGVDIIKQDEIKHYSNLSNGYNQKLYKNNDLRAVQTGDTETNTDFDINKELIMNDDKLKGNSYKNYDMNSFDTIPPTYSKKTKK